jgi:hypothetical protein
MAKMNWVRFPETMQDASGEWNIGSVGHPTYVPEFVHVAEQDQSCFFAYCNGAVSVGPPRNRHFFPETGICFQNVPKFADEPNSDLYLCELTPRNIVWVNDMAPENFQGDDFWVLTHAEYTHAIICFFHLDAGPTLVYNGPGNNPNQNKYKPWWEYLRSLREGPNYKTLILSVGGWNSGTWFHARNHEKAGAKLIVDFARDHGFAGIDFNFEGPYRFNGDELSTFAQMVLEVREQMHRQSWYGLFTITPMRDNIGQQLASIEKAVGHPLTWSDYLSWINVQFYHYNNGRAVPVGDVVYDYDTVLRETGLPASMIAAGFPLEDDINGLGEDAVRNFNVGEFQKAIKEVSNIRKAHRDFAGMFVWRFRGTQRNNVPGVPWGFRWARRFSLLLETPYRQHFQAEGMA